MARRGGVSSHEEQTFKDALLKKRTEILGTGGIKPLQASMENNTRQGDMADQASGNNEVHIAAQAETDRRQDPAGDRRGAVADREGHLRRLPRLRRADRAGAPRTPSRGRASASPARKSRTRDRPPLPLLQEFYREKLALLLRHQAGARLIGQYDANNTYQYIINREETQLTWVARPRSPSSAAPCGRQRAGASGQGRPRRGRPSSRKMRATRSVLSSGGGRASTR